VGLAKLLVADHSPVRLSVLALVLLIRAESKDKTSLDREDKISTVTLEDVLDLSLEVLHGASVEGDGLHSALHATAAGGDEVQGGLTLLESNVNGVVVGIATVLLRVLEGSVSGLIAELETVAHLDVSVATTDDLPNERGGHL